MCGLFRMKNVVMDSIFVSTQLELALHSAFVVMTYMYLDHFEPTHESLVVAHIAVDGKMTHFQIPYSGNLLWVETFANFVVSGQFVKVSTEKTFMEYGGVIINGMSLFSTA